MSFSLTIGGDVKPIHRDTSFSLNWRLGGRGTLSFSTFSLDGSYEPALGAEVRLSMGGTVIWGGNIARVKTTAMYADSGAGTPSISACEAVSYEARLDKRIVPVAVYLNKTCKEIITDIIQVKLLDGSPAAYEIAGDLDNVLAGVTIAKLVIDHARFSDVLDDLAARSGYCWFVEPVTQDLYFIPRNQSPILQPAPFSISDADPNCREVSVERMMDGFRDKQFIRISYAAFAVEDDSFVGDATGSPLSGTMQWTLPGLVNYVEAITVLEGSPATETAKTFGVHGIDSDREFYYAPGEATIWQDAGGTPLDPTLTLRVQWRELGADVMSVYNTTAQWARQIAEGGGTGLYDHLVDDSGMVDAVGELAKAQALLDAKSVIPVDVSGVTDEPGLRPGQILSVSLTVPNAASSVLIDTVDAAPRGDGALRYSFHASTAAYDDWVQVWQQALGGAGGGISGSGGGGIVTPPAGAEPIPPAPAGEAPNQTPKTSGPTACRVVYSARDVQTVWQFAGAVTFATNAANYANLASIEVAAVLTSGNATDRILGYLNPPAAGGGNVDVEWFTDLWPLPVSADDTWTLEFRSLNSDGIATATPPTVAGLVVRHESTHADTGLTIPPVTGLAVTNWGIDAIQQTQGFRVAWTNPAAMANVFGFKIRIATPGIPAGQDVTGVLPFPAYTASVAVVHIVNINRSDIPFVSENWTFSVVTINAAQDGDNLAAPAPSYVIAVGAGGTVPDLIAPLLPATVVGADIGVRQLIGANETYTWIRATVTLPANHRATRLILWESEDGGTTWGNVTSNWLVSGGLTFDFQKRVPATTQTDWKVKVTTASDQVTNPESTAVVSSAFTVTTLAAPGAALITDGAAGSITYAPPDADGIISWGNAGITWTNPTSAAYPEFYHSQLKVWKCDASGNPSSDYEGTKRVVAESTDAGAAVSVPLEGWTMPDPASAYHHFFLELYVLNRNGNTILQTTAWSGAAYLDLAPTEQTGAIRADRLAPTKLGSGLSIGLEKASGGTRVLRPTQTHTDNLLPNADFQLAHPTTASWADKWTKSGTVTRETSGAETGEALMKLANDGYIESETIRVGIGDRYALSFRAKAESGFDGTLYAIYRLTDVTKTYWAYYAAWNSHPFTPTTAWATYGCSSDVPATDVDNSGSPTFIPYYLSVLIYWTAETGGKFAYVDRCEVSSVRVQQDEVSAGVTTAVTLGQHLNPSSQFTGLSARRSTGWATEILDDRMQLIYPSGRIALIMTGVDSSPDRVSVRFNTDASDAYPFFQFDLSTPGMRLYQSASNYIELRYNGTTAELWMNGVLKLSEA